MPATRPPLLVLLAVAITLSAHAEAPLSPPPVRPPPEAIPIIEATALPGWDLDLPTPEAVDEDAPIPPGAQPLGGMTMAPRTGARLESALVTGGRSPTFAATTLRAYIATSEQVAFGVALPMVFAPEGGRAVDTGNLTFDGQWRLTPDRPGEIGWTGALRFLFPAATHDRHYVLVPARTRTATGGLEGAVALHRITSAWSLHIEFGGGVYIDNLMALRLGVSAATTYRLIGLLHGFAQLDPWLVWVPGLDSTLPTLRAMPQLGTALGLELRFERLSVSAAYQKIIGHTNDHHLWLTFDVVL